MAIHCPNWVLGDCTLALVAVEVLKLYLRIWLRTWVSLVYAAWSRLSNVIAWGLKSAPPSPTSPATVWSVNIESGYTGYWVRKGKRAKERVLPGMSVHDCWKPRGVSNNPAAKRRIQVLATWWMRARGSLVVSEGGS